MSCDFRLLRGETGASKDFLPVSYSTTKAQTYPISKLVPQLNDLFLMARRNLYLSCL
ncbi:hypothetical protein M407DRAFT_241082 [Tulasnella calospora MUT 4182]|uniref:Uncharacterized protein n=1 Tax=Tulasnella calospora MUT 4182 TaxID=1051891 RepID=A0A0C3LGY3_9AGAM|nr:hypothetical protein M407DRAFT_241082 [Tulasnella calospora MUT 4182]